MLRSTRRLWLSLVGACAVLYFGYHAVQGERGLVALLTLERQLDRAEATLRSIETGKSVLERNVALLRTSSLDRDMLEERVRIVLNYARPDEIVIMRTDLPLPPEPDAR